MLWWNSIVYYPFVFYWSSVWLLLLMSQRLSWRMSASSLNKKLRDVEYLYSWSITSRHSYHHNIKKFNWNQILSVSSIFPFLFALFLAFCICPSVCWWWCGRVLYAGPFLKTNVHHHIIKFNIKKWRPRLFVFARLAALDGFVLIWQSSDSERRENKRTTTTTWYGWKTKKFE